MTSISEVSESEALEYIRAELQVLQPILGELLDGPSRSMGTRRAPRSITRRSSIPPRRTLEYGHRVATDAKL